MKPIVCLLFAVALSLASAPADILYDNFEDVSDLQFNYGGTNSPTAQTTGSPDYELIVNDGSLGSQANAIWYKTKQNAETGFETVFNWSHNNFDAGTFTIQNESVTAVGGGGGSSGASGISNGITLRMDRSGNWALKNTATWTDIATGSGTTLNEGEVKITYDGTTLRIYEDGSTTPVTDGEVVVSLDGYTDASGQAWVGFTSGSGSLTEDVLVADWSYTPEPCTTACLVCGGLLVLRRRSRMA